MNRSALDMTHWPSVAGLVVFPMGGVLWSGVQYHLWHKHWPLVLSSWRRWPARGSGIDFRACAPSPVFWYVVARYLIGIDRPQSAPIYPEQGPTTERAYCMIYASLQCESQITRSHVCMRGGLAPTVCTKTGNEFWYHEQCGITERRTLYMYHSNFNWKSEHYSLHLYNDVG